jgi:5-oxoprolinase (ATP-hydrolysing)
VVRKSRSEAAGQKAAPSAMSGCEFWIDVGGTFTDSFARMPDGELKHYKVLSSGVIKGSLAAGSTRAQVFDPARASDPPGMWSDFEFVLLDEDGHPLERARVASFLADKGAFVLDPPLTHEPVVGRGYELSAGMAAPLVAIRYLLGLPLSEAIPACSVRLGTTRGTNALITRTGGRTALVTTRGFGDILHIGNQNRPRLFDLTIRKPQPLFSAVVEIEERITADGSVLQAPDESRIRAQLAELRDLGIQSLAICLLHGFAHPAHEMLIARVAEELGFHDVSVSSRVAPLVKIVSRGDTTVLDAYLNPVLRDYVRQLRTALAGSSLRILTSAGGLVEADKFLGKDSILSGPAGGVVGYAEVARAAGFPRAIGFDMGGTSTDVSRFDGRYELEFETEKAGVRVVAPMLAIETVAAGGGSICRFDGVRLLVGPESAGAQPGPACYGRGGPLSLTDVNLLLGRIRPERFPFPLDRAAAEARLQDVLEAVLAAGGPHYKPLELAEGFVHIANAHMVKAIASISVARGYDPREYVLVPFGGAAGQHACAVARELGISQILHHPHAGLLSAFGIGKAEIERHAIAAVYEPLSPALVERLESTFERLAAETSAGVAVEGVPRDRIATTRAIELRYRGVETGLWINCPPGTAADQLVAAYRDAHRLRYGYVHEGRALEAVSVRVESRGGASVPAGTLQFSRHAEPAAPRTAQACFLGQLYETSIIERAELAAGRQIVGPAIVCEPTSTVVIEPGWRATVLAGGELLIGQVGAAQTPLVSSQADPVQLEVFNSRFAAIAEQMGITLRNTASSVNVKERLDFSCALFTPTGDLVVNAPHIPVHLGAMAETVKRVLLDNPDLAPGDVYVTNDPYRGGSHLPDITVVTPVHDERGGLQFFTASRAHHAEIGGITPGSMPPFSKSLAEEGVLIRNFKLVSQGSPRWDELRDLLLAGTYPTRDVEANLADLAAQVAANHRGASDLLLLVERYSAPVVSAYMRHIQDAAERKMRAALAARTPGRYEFLDHLDDATPLAVAITIEGGAATIDFSGTGPVSSGNLNANRAITTAAVMYVLRAMIAEDIPLNQGVLAPVKIVLPAGLLNPPEHADPGQCAAVAGGNVETSQRVVDVLLGALSLAAASQGTMNNLLFGDNTFGYYETICGGAGATAEGKGADAVHTHMTNTRLTDPEVLERRYPVRVRRFHIRRGSGGTGLHRGGEGVVRELEFLTALDVSLVTGRRGAFPPYGLEGGGPGQLGRNWLVRADGSRQELAGLAQFHVEPGDVLVIETPGGGGWGAA